jgi:HD superfamily phosphohydrolase
MKKIVSEIPVQTQINNIADVAAAHRTVESRKSKVDERPDFEQYLKYSKVIRDAVHGDIWLTDLEMKIIDTPIFQRLRRIKQLGPTDLVYPSAKHTRFEHSIGALFVAQQIIDAINKNHANGLSKYAIDPRETITIRILALIHDMAHFPYGHTIEDEGKLFDAKQWADEDRFRQIFGEISTIIESYLKDLPSEDRTIIIQDIGFGLKAEESEDKDEYIHSSDRPFIVDIVGNTICADLLDYLKRDAYCTGLKTVYDPRILSYFILTDMTNSNDVNRVRAAILLQKKGKIKNDILNYCVDLLRMRYSLAEKSHFHRVKCIASAMVIKMIYCALEEGIISKNKEDKHYLLAYCDDSLIFKIMTYENETNDEYSIAAKKIADRIFNRVLYKEIYSKNYTNEIDYENLIKFSDKKERYKKEREIELACSLEPGSVVIYCPEQKAGKVAETKTVRYDNSGSPIVKTLKALSQEDNYKASIGEELAILDVLHKRLWSFLVLVDKPLIVDDDGQILTEKFDFIKKVCEELINKGTLGIDAVFYRDYLLGGKSTTTQIRTIARELATAKEPRGITDGIQWIDKRINSIRSSDGS